MTLKDGGKSAAEMKEEWLGNMELHFSCAFCTWNFDGGLTEGRQAADDHRAEKHPEIPPYRRPRKRAVMRPTWRAGISDQDKEEVEAERHRRAVLLGIAIDK